MKKNVTWQKFKDHFISNLAQYTVTALLMVIAAIGGWVYGRARDYSSLPGRVQAVEEANVNQGELLLEVQEDIVEIKEDIDDIRDSDSRQEEREIDMKKKIDDLYLKLIK